jgi:hypothetical protein
VLLGTPPAAAEQDKDLDLIPEAIQRPPDASAAPTAPATVDARQRLYLESAVIGTARRGGLVVPFPPPLPASWEDRLFFDARKEWTLSDRASVTYSGRLNLRAGDEIDTPSHQNVRHDFREGFVSWEPADRDYLDLGRINLKNGVALGFNPTDFFKTRAVVEPLTADPTVLREDRLGTVMLRGQLVREGFAAGFAVAPDLAEQSRIYTNDTLPSFDPMLDRTNAHNRFLVTATPKIAGDVAPEFLVYHETNRTQIGTNLTEAVGQKTVLYLEWAGGRRASLIDDALRFGRQTGSLPLTAPSILPETSRTTFQNDLSVGASYTTEDKITFNLEYHLHEAGFTRADWRNWFARGHAGNPATAAQLWYLRAYALDQQEPLSRHTAFLRANWVDAFVPKLELTALATVDLYDGSGTAQLTADYYLTDAWTVGALAAGNFGGAHADFGSLPTAASVLFKVARYF